MRRPNPLSVRAVENLIRAIDELVVVVVTQASSVDKLLHELHHQRTTIMADLASFNATIDAVAASQAKVSADVQNLKDFAQAANDKIATLSSQVTDLQATIDALLAAGSISAADAQALQDRVTALGATAEQIDADLDAIAPDPTAPTP